MLTTRSFAPLSLLAPQGMSPEEIDAYMQRMEAAADGGDGSSGGGEGAEADSSNAGSGDNTAQ